MNGRRIRIGLASALALTALSAGAAGAQASYHEMRISEIHASDGVGDPDYVELQMYAPGQNLVTGRYIRTYDNSGLPFDTYTFPTNLPPAKNQSTILIADGPTVAGKPVDFDASTAGGLNVLTGAGAVCYLQSLAAGDGLDCVVYGLNFGAGGIQGNPSPFGSHALNTADGLMAGQTLQRSIKRGCESLFELSDDTNDGSDFALGAPSPRNSSAAPSGKALPEYDHHQGPERQDHGPDPDLQVQVESGQLELPLQDRRQGVRQVHQSGDAEEALLRQAHLQGLRDQQPRRHRQVAGQAEVHRQEVALGPRLGRPGG